MPLEAPVMRAVFCSAIMSGMLRQLAVVLCLAAAPLAAQTPAPAPPPATGAVQLEISPGTIQLAPNEKKAVLAIVRNPAAPPLEKLSLRKSPNADVQVDGGPP